MLSSTSEMSPLTKQKTLPPSSYSTENISTALSMNCTKQGTQIYADRYDSTSVLSHNYPVRAQWCKKPGSQSTLFHRWLLHLTGSPDDHGFEYVEHLNDLALDCRESNMRKSTTLHGNNLHMNRLKHAFWVEGVKGAACKSRGNQSIAGVILEHRTSSAATA